MDSIDSVRARLPVDFDRVLRKIRKAGTDNLSFFGGGYELEGGYSLQQNPEEFAAAVVFLQERLVVRRNHSVYLEIGAASGGACRFLWEHLGFAQVWVVDDHGHHRWPEQQAHFDAIGTKTFWSDGKPLTREPIVHAWIGNSHSEPCLDWLKKMLEIRPPDLSFIDGDHSFDGCWADLNLVRSLAGTRGSLVMLHDIVACEGVRRTWQSAIAEKTIEPLAELVGREKPLGIGIGRLA